MSAAETVRLEIFGAEDVEPVVADVPPNERILDACDDARAAIPFSCRSATCGTCIVHVLDGAELVEPADAEEAEVLRSHAASPDERLACRLVVSADHGTIRLRARRG
ncbi:MAG: (2Fe-2S)-binding protein [Polyangiaceae bacterium]|nr:(2Fe-2S)-binding protein [Polyangiaceae bacterium]